MEEPPTAEPDAEPDAEAEAEEPAPITTAQPTFALVTGTPVCICREPDPKRRWTWPPAKVEATPTPQPLRVVGPMPDFANLRYDVFDGNGCTTETDGAPSGTNDDAPADTTDDSNYDDEYGSDVVTEPWWMDLSSSVLADYTDGDTNGAPSGTNGDPDSGVGPDDGDYDSAEDDYYAYYMGE